MKILIISPGDLPVPAVKGGAVEALIESLIIQNERKKEFDLTVVSKYNKQALEESKKYSNTSFLYIKEPCICTIIDKMYEFFYSMILRKPHNILKKYAWKIYVVEKTKKFVRKNEFDRVVMENAGYLLKILNDENLSQKYKNKLFYHLHNDVPKGISKSNIEKCKILAVSSYLNNQLIQYYGEEIKKNVYILKNGFDTTMYTSQISEEEKKEIREKLEIDKDKRIIIYAGRINEAKGIKQLVDAFETIKNRENCVLMIVGAHNFGEKQYCPFERNIIKKIDNMGEQAKFTGFINHAEIWKYYKISSVAVLPSMWEEPAGLTMIEAAAAGIPVITTKSGGIPEYMNEDLAILLEKNEKIVDSIANSIDEVLENKGIWKLKAQKMQREIVEQFNEEKYFDNFSKIIK